MDHWTSLMRIFITHFKLVLRSILRMQLDYLVSWCKRILNLVRSTKLFELIFGRCAVAIDWNNYFDLSQVPEWNNHSNFTAFILPKLTSDEILNARIGYKRDRHPFAAEVTFIELEPNKSRGTVKLRSKESRWCWVTLTWMVSWAEETMDIFKPRVFDEVATKI